MTVITLNIKEREKFVAYLEQEAVTNKGMAEQMEKLKIHEAVVKRLKMKAVACIIIADDLRRTEDMNIGKEDEEKELYEYLLNKRG